MPTRATAHAPSWKIVQLVFWRKPDADCKKGIKSFGAIELTAVMSNWYATSVVLRMEEAITCGWDRRYQLPANTGFDDSLVTKTMGMTGTKRRRTETWVFAARNVASLDIKTAFDVAKPRNIWQTCRGRAKLNHRRVLIHLSELILGVRRRTWEPVLVPVSHKRASAFRAGLPHVGRSQSRP